MNRRIFSFILPGGLMIAMLAAGYWNVESDKNNLTGSTEKGNIEAEYIPVDPATKQKGAHLFARMELTDFEPLHKANIEWITLVSWGYLENCSDPHVSHHNGDSTMIQQTNINWINRINLVQDAGFKVFVKPHIWISSPEEGKWRSDIYPTNDANWELWKESYREYILRYARIAEEAGAEMFSVGAEFAKLTKEKPEYWQSLIREVRGIYSGKITYAANWYKEYENIYFWEDLDFIGIQAYFPLSKKKYPSVKQISKGWNKYIPKLKSIHKKFNRPILFTEMGYKSIADSAREPWTWLENMSDRDHMYSAETQANCYQAFFETIWGQEWFAGVHIWQLRGNYKPKDGKNNLDFTPQGKPAENVIAKGFESPRK